MFEQFQPGQCRKIPEGTRKRLENHVFLNSKQQKGVSKQKMSKNRKLRKKWNLFSTYILQIFGKLHCAKNPQVDLIYFGKRYIVADIKVGNFV